MTFLKYRSSLFYNSFLFCHRFQYRFYRHLFQRNYSFSKELNKVIWSSNDVRKAFIDFFVKDHNHNYVHSSPVFLRNDPSLLFVNAGMNQFKPKFLGSCHSSHQFSHLKRAANSQKCIRLGGKHNDFQYVGKDLYHHTFFEMLGNWSFGDYFKAEACSLAWNLLTDVYQINPEQLYITYFAGDHSLGLEEDLECKNIWLKLGVTEDHIFPFGIKDNFWEMGDTGPCGPCTEIHYDHLGLLEDAPSAKHRINASRPDLVELWNVVFMQYDRQQDGSLINLPTHHVDTGMGLERLLAVLNRKISNYDTDLFTPIFDAIQKTAKVRPYLGSSTNNEHDKVDTAYRILADHSRMFCIAIADGILPDEIDAGFCLRRVMRNACFTAKFHMNAVPGMVASLAPVVVKSLEMAFPELNEKIPLIIDTVNEEEAIFLRTLEKGSNYLNEIKNDSSKCTLSGKQAYTLHKYGLFDDIIDEMSKANGMEVNWDEFHKELAIEKEKRFIHSSAGDNEFSEISTKVLLSLKNKNIPCTDDSYKYHYELADDEKNYKFDSINSTVVSIIKNGMLTCQAEENEKCHIILDKTNFYFEAGGQVSDKGVIVGNNFKFLVESVQAKQNYVLHYGHVQEGRVESGRTCKLTFDKEHRMQCMRNHTASHLLNAALRKIFPTTEQNSVLIDPMHLSFSFTSKVKLTSSEIEHIENYINDAIKKEYKVTRNVMPLNEAFENPKLVTLPGESYPEKVSVIAIGQDELESPLSVELCCGTHLHTTAGIDHFAIVSHTIKSQRIKKIKAVTSQQALSAILKGAEISAKIEDFKEKAFKLDHVCYKTVFKYMADLRHIRTEIKDLLLPEKRKEEFKKSLKAIDIHLENLRNKYNTRILKRQMKKEIKKAVKESTSKSYIIHKLNVIGDYKVIIHVLPAYAPDMPMLLFFHCVKGNLYCSCCIPKGSVTSFNSSEWLSAVAATIEAHMYVVEDCGLFEIMTMRCFNESELEDAMLTARKFANNHTNCSNLAIER